MSRSLHDYIFIYTHYLFMGHFKIDFKVFIMHESHLIHNSEPPLRGFNTNLTHILASSRRNPNNFLQRWRIWKYCWWNSDHRIALSLRILCRRRNTEMKVQTPWVALLANLTLINVFPPQRPLTEWRYSRPRCMNREYLWISNLQLLHTRMVARKGSCDSCCMEW